MIYNNDLYDNDLYDNDLQLYEKIWDACLPAGL